MKKTIFAVIMTIAILFGMSTVGNAQDDKSNTPVKNEKKKSSPGKFMKALNSGKPATKKVSGPTASVKANQAKSEAAAKKTADSTAAADAQKQTNDKIADLEKQLSDKNAENANLKALADQKKAEADASKANADSLTKQLYAVKITPETDPAKNKANKSIESEAPVASNAAPEQNDPAPVPAPVQKPVYHKPAQTKVLAVMSKDGNWVTVTQNYTATMPKKGELLKEGNTVYVRASDVESGKLNDQIEAYKKLGFVLEKVHK